MSELSGAIKLRSAQWSKTFEQQSKREWTSLATVDSPDWCLQVGTVSLYHQAAYAMPQNSASKSNESASRSEVLRGETLSKWAVCDTYARLKIPSGKREDYQQEEKKRSCENVQNNSKLRNEPHSKIQWLKTQKLDWKQVWWCAPWQWEIFIENFKGRLLNRYVCRSSQVHGAVFRTTRKHVAAWQELDPAVQVLPLYH